MLREEIEKEFNAVMKERFRPVLHVLPKLEALKEKVLAALPKSEEVLEEEKPKKGKKNGKEEESSK